MSDALYSVKEAGALDAMSRFGAGALATLRNGATAAFAAHPLPTYTRRVDATPGFAANLWRRLQGKAPFAGKPRFRTETATGYGPGVGNFAKTVGHGVGDFAREAVLGSPVTVARELKAKGLGGVYRDAFMPGGSGMSLALSAALPAYDLYNASQQPAGERGAAYGRAVADTALMPLTSRLGIPGQLLLRTPVANLAGRVGRLFDRPPPAPPENDTAPPYTGDAH